jgi:hypothetical protein
MQTSATRTTFTRWPEAPDSRSELEDATGYWTALLHLLLYRLGWSRPDIGLDAWYRAGRPTSDRVLRLIDRTYGADGQLDLFASFLWMRWPDAGWSHPFRTGPDSPRVEPDPEFVARATAVAEALGIPNPLSGGSDPLHLLGHCFGPLEPPVPAAEVRHNKAGRVTLRIDAGLGWYAALQLTSNARALPETVSVEVKGVGRLGTFRRSPNTGLWHSVSEAAHLAGQ